MPKWLDRLLGRTERSLDPYHIENFNLGVELCETGVFDAAGDTFADLCDDKSCPANLRMAAGYARALMDSRVGQAPTIPSDFAGQTDQMVVNYCLFTVAGLLAKDEYSTTYPEENRVIVRTEQSRESFFYRFSYQDAMGNVLTDVSRISESGATIHLEMEDDPTPQQLDTFMLAAAKAAGSGAHDPIHLPTEWAPPVQLPAEPPAQ